MASRPMHSVSEIQLILESLLTLLWCHRKGMVTQHGYLHGPQRWSLFHNAVHVLVSPFPTVPYEGSIMFSHTQNTNQWGMFKRLTQPPMNDFTHNIMLEAAKSGGNHGKPYGILFDLKYPSTPEKKNKQPGSKIKPLWPHQRKIDLGPAQKGNRHRWQ